MQLFDTHGSVIFAKINNRQVTGMFRGASWAGGIPKFHSCFLTKFAKMSRLYPWFQPNGENVAHVIKLSKTTIIARGATSDDKSITVADTSMG